MRPRRVPLAAQIFLALGLGILAGLCLTGAPELAAGWIAPFGTIFLNLLQFLVVPLVFCSILSGLFSLGDVRAVGSIGVISITQEKLCPVGLLEIG